MIDTRYLLGIDGGGSKTQAVVTDETGRLLGEGTTGCGNHQVNGVQLALDNIRWAGEQAMAAAGLVPGDVSFTQFGLAGADREKDFAILREALTTLSWGSWDLVCDTLIGLRTGSDHPYGVILICGSGTNAAGVNRAGKFMQTGGFGYLYGDTAGGAYMAVETFRAAVRAWEGREQPSLLTDMVIRFFGYATMEALFYDFLDHDVSDLPGELTVVLHEAAAQGDKVARAILNRTGHELGLAANSVIKRLGGFPDEHVPIVLSGSVFQKGRSPDLLDALSTTIRTCHTDYSLVIPDMDPVYGAILLAMDHVGINTDQTLNQRFASYGYRE